MTTPRYIYDHDADDHKMAEAAPAPRSCPVCGRTPSNSVEEWDDSMELLCFGADDPLCVPSEKVKAPK